VTETQTPIRRRSLSVVGVKNAAGPRDGTKLFCTGTGIGSDEFRQIDAECTKSGTLVPGDGAISTTLVL